MTRRKSIDRIRRHAPVPAGTLEALARLYGGRASDADLSTLADSYEREPDTRELEEGAVDEAVRLGEAAYRRAQAARRRRG